MVDQALRRNSVRPMTTIWVPSYLNAMAMIGCTDMLAIIPSRLFKLHGRHFGLRSAPSPVILPAIEEIAIWHPRNDADPAHNWLTQLMGEVAAKLL
jgi:DNA-binding transcriptional LysR family regulator